MGVEYCVIGGCAGCGGAWWVERARSIRCGERRDGAESIIEGWGEVTASPGGEGGGGESGGGKGDGGMGNGGLGDGAAGWAAVARACGRQQLQRACAGVTGLRQLARHIRLRPVHDKGGAEGGGDPDEDERAEARSRLALRLYVG